MDSFDPAWLDRMYNNRALVPDHPVHFERWASESAAARAALACEIDVRYGPGENETLDIFHPATTPAASSRDADGAPVLIFIHGGWWRSLDKSDHSFVARGFVERGVCVVIPNYALCPGTPARPVGIADIAMQMVRAVEWTWRHIASRGGDPSRITVSGHSAGGHLSAMLMGCDWKAVAPDLPSKLVRNALSISGLHDLRPIQHVPYLADSLRLSAADALRLSPALWPAPAEGKLFAAVGAEESDEFIRQNAAIRDAWGARTVPVCEALYGLHHFSIVGALADPSHLLHRHAMRLLGE